MQIRYLYSIKANCMSTLEIILFACLAAFLVFSYVAAKADSKQASGQSRKHWTEDMADPEERPQRHWTEFLDNSDEAQDRDDDWEWDRQDDLGDSWDGEEL